MSERAGIPPSTRMPCDLCGAEYQASRTMPGVPPFVCSDCQSHTSGHWDGVAEALAVALAAQGRGDSLSDFIRELEESLRKKERHE